MATRKAEVVVTCNIRQPQQAQKILITALESLQKKYDDLVRKGRQNEAETQKLKATMDGLASAVKTNEANMNRIKAVMNDLGGSTLRQLNAAMRELKKQMSGKSQNSSDLDSLRKKYNAITEQIKILKGETLDITKGMRTLSNQTDAWLTKAIAKQKDLMAQTRRNTLEYQAQKSVLKHLTAEQNRRTNLAIRTKGNAAMAVAMNPAKASMGELRDARQNLMAFRDSIGKSGISFGSGKANASQIKVINEMLAAIDKQIDSINGKEQKVALTAQQIAQSVRQIDFSKASPKQLKAKLDEVNNALANMGKNDPMRGQLLQSAQQLQMALDGLDGKLVNVKGVLANLDKASPQKLQAALNQVNRDLERMGQNDKRRKILVQQANQLREALARVDKEAVDVNKVLNSLKSAPLKDLKKAASQLEKEMERLDRTTAAYSSKRSQLQQIRNEIAKTNVAVSSQGSAWKKTYAAISSYMGVTMIIGKIQQLITDAIKGNLALSDQLANIRKVSLLAMSDINDLSKSLAGMDTRTKLSELNHIAYAGAKLGIGKYGAEGLAQFTRAADQVNVALKEDLGDDALTALSKITEVMGLIPKMGVEKSMLAVGSAMFQLSATSTATAGNIVEFSKRLTGLAKVSGITTDQLLGLASASDAMYLMPEVSATAFNKLFTSIQTKHNLIEQNLAIEPGTINNLFSAGRAMEAIVLIFEKMKEKGNMNALQGIFKDLGSDGSRLVNVMVTMSQNVDMLKEHLDTSKEAFDEAIAVTREYRMQQETAAALMERANNIWSEAFINTDGVDNVKGLAQAWYNVSKSLTESPMYVNQLKASLSLIIGLVQVLIRLMPTLLTFFMFKGAVAAIWGVCNAFKVCYVSIVAATGAAKTLQAVLSSNIIGAVATLVMLLVSAFQSLADKGGEVVSMENDLKNAVAGTSSEVVKATEKLKSYLTVLESANDNEEQRARVLKQFNKEYSPYLTKLGIEVNNVKELKKHYKELNEEISKKLWYQARAASYEKHLNSYADKMDDKRVDIYDDLRNASLFSPFSVKDVLDADKYLGYNPGYLSLLSQAAGGTKHTYKITDPDTGEKVDYDGYELPEGYWTQTARYEYKDENGRKMSHPYPYLVNANGDKIGYGDSYGRLHKDIYDYGTIALQSRTDKKKIDDIYNPYIGDYDPFTEPSPGTLDADAEDKDAKRKKEEKDREELNGYRDEVKSALINIRNFYERQIAIVTEKANSEGWNESYISKNVEYFQSQMRKALMDANNALSQVGPRQWKEFHHRMEDDMIEEDGLDGYNISKGLLEEIESVDLWKIPIKMFKLERDLGLKPRSTLAKIKDEATRNYKADETAEYRALKKRQEIALENNATGRVDRDYTNSMTELGFFNVQDYTDDTALAEAYYAARQEEIDEMFKNVREKIVEIYAVGDVKTDEGKNRLLTILFGENWREDVARLSNICDLTGEEMEIFYSQLIGYYDDYAEAQKKAIDRQRKLLDFRWNRSDEKISYDKKTRNDELYQKGLLQHFNPDEAEKRPGNGVYGNTRFISNFGVDPEIESLKAKMELEQARMEFLRANAAEEALLADQQNAIYEAQAEYVAGIANRIRSQMDEVLSMTTPVSDFGTKMGEAFAMMSQDAGAARDMMRSAIGDMINDLMKQTVEMTKEYIKRRLMQKMHDRLMQNQMKKESNLEAGLESKKQDKLLEVQAVGGEAKEMLTEQVGAKVQDVTQKIGQEALQTEEAQTGQEMNTEMAATQAKTTMGIAQGASKIIGTLGWWGIPLVAVITALLNGLLSMAMSKVSSLFGGGKNGSSSSTTSQTKLVTGMLTYDKGNVQSFRGVLDGKSYPVVGDDGRVYAATDSKKLETGLVKDPITTLVNGQPALVAERGPEIVIGRETTAAMMMARPDILAEIVKFDRLRSGRAYKAYDGGNLDGIGIADSVASGVNAEDLSQLRTAISTLCVLLSSLQRNGIDAHINKYGRGGIAETAKSGSKFMRRNSGDPLWRN